MTHAVNRMQLKLDLCVVMHVAVCGGLQLPQNSNNVASTSATIFKPYSPRLQAERLASKTIHMQIIIHLNKFHFNRKQKSSVSAKAMLVLSDYQVSNDKNNNTFSKEASPFSPTMKLNQKHEAICFKQKELTLERLWKLLKQSEVLLNKVSLQTVRSTFHTFWLSFTSPSAKADMVPSWKPFFTHPFLEN